MNKRILAGSLVMAVMLIVSLSTTFYISRDGLRDGIFQPTPTLPAVMNRAYENECGACHFAYQPGWLPARSWKKMMGHLDDHFDENAELGKKAHDEITSYLIAESADAKPHRKSHHILASIREYEAPFRISNLAYMLEKHNEIPVDLVAGNDKVRSFANCLACHSGAANGRFNDADVRIPGYGAWND